MQKKIRFTLNLILILLAVLMITNCGSSGGGGGSSDSGGNSGAPTTTESAATFRTGNDIIVNTSTINNSGGTITITDTGTYLDGVQITFPAGSLQSSTEIKVGYNDGAVNFPEGMTSSAGAKTLTIHTNGGSEFSQLVEITIHYTDEQNIPV